MSLNIQDDLYKQFNVEIFAVNLHDCKLGQGSGHIRQCNTKRMIPQILLHQIKVTF